MHISLKEILALVGNLDDAPAADSARERFRKFLASNVREVGELRDHIEECLRTSGDQYNRALQDLVNFLGRFIGFDVDPWCCWRHRLRWALEVSHRASRCCGNQDN